MTEGVIIQSAIRGGSWWRVCRCHTSTACNIDGIWLCLLNTGLFSGWRSIRWTFRKHETTHSTRRSAFISAINVHLWAWWVLSLHLPDVLIAHTSQREGFHSEKLWCRQRKWRNEGLHSLHLLCRRDNKSYMINQTDGTFSARLTTWNSSSTLSQSTVHTENYRKTCWKDVQQRAERKFLWGCFLFSTFSIDVQLTSSHGSKLKFLNCNFRLLFSSSHRRQKLKFLRRQNFTPCSENDREDLKPEPEPQ